MKYTSLFSAVAIAAAMGTQALATVTTNDVNVTEGTFEAKTIGTAGQVLGGNWTVQTEDQSEVLYAPLSSQDAVEGYTANKHLKLNTEGNELVWNPGNVSEPKSIIEMKVRLVASDTAPAISAEDTTVHAAVYLQVSEPVDANNDGLYAYTATGWEKLDAPFNAQLATGSMVALRVLMDYEHMTATYEGCVLTDAENNVPVYVNLGTKNMAHPTVGQNGSLTSVGFKGTGGIDDLFVKEIEETPSEATINFELWAGGEDPEDDDSDTLDTVEAGSSAGTAFTLPSGTEVKTVELYENGTLLTWTVEPTVDGEGNISVSMANYTFVAEHTYLVKITAGEPATTYTVTFTTAHGTAPAAQTVEDGAKATAPADPSEAGWVFKGWTLNGSAYDFNTAVSADITLVASWKQLFTVTFDANGHGTAPAAQSVEDGATATDPGALTAEGYTFNGWTLSGSAYSFATPVTGNITLVADWTEVASLEDFSIGDNLPQGVAPIVIDGNKFIVNVVVPQGATATLLGADTVGGTYTDVNAVATDKTGYTELAYTMGQNETAKFFKVKFTK